jgi:hypothetical protein
MPTPYRKIPYPDDNLQSLRAISDIHPTLIYCKHQTIRKPIKLRMLTMMPEKGMKMEMGSFGVLSCVKTIVLEPKNPQNKN